MSVYALKALVNHSLGGDVTAGDVQHSTERLRVPAQRVADELRRLCRIDDGAEVTNVCQRSAMAKGDSNAGCLAASPTLFRLRRKLLRTYLGDKNWDLRRTLPAQIGCRFRTDLPSRPTAREGRNSKVVRSVMLRVNSCISTSPPKTFRLRVDHTQLGRAVLFCSLSQPVLESVALGSSSAIEVVNIRRTRSAS